MKRGVSVYISAHRNRESITSSTVNIVEARQGNMKFLYLALVVLAVVGCAVSSGSKPVLPARCTLPIEGGPCRAYLIRYGHNTNTNRCEKFVYGGCPGNDNRFNTLLECKNICQFGK